MKNQLALPSLLAGTTLLGALSYLLIKPGKAKAKKTKKLMLAAEDNSECFI